MMTLVLMRIRDITLFLVDKAFVGKIYNVYNACLDVYGDDFTSHHCT